MVIEPVDSTSCAACRSARATCSQTSREVFCARRERAGRGRLGGGRTAIARWRSGSGSTAGVTDSTAGSGAMRAEAGVIALEGGGRCSGAGSTLQPQMGATRCSGSKCSASSGPAQQQHGSAPPSQARARVACVLNAATSVSTMAMMSRTGCTYSTLHVRASRSYPSMAQAQGVGDHRHRAGEREENRFASHASSVALPAACCG